MTSATTLTGLCLIEKGLKLHCLFSASVYCSILFICWFISTLTRWTRNLLLWVYPLHMNPFMQWCFVDHQRSFFFSIKDKIRKRSTSSLAHLCFSLSAKSQHKTDLFVFLNQFPAAQKSQAYLQSSPGLPYTLILSSDIVWKGLLLSSCTSGEAPALKWKQALSVPHGAQAQASVSDQQGTIKAGIVK